MTVLRAAILIGLAACGASNAWTESDVVLTQYSPLSRNAEIARRALPPLTYQRFQQALATQGLHLSEQAIDLARERFELYVPSGPPPARGYAVLVFVVSRRSMRDACVFDVKTETMFGMGHEPLDAVGMDRALDDLEAPRAVDEAELARCNARVEREIAAALADAAAAIARGDRDGARAKIKAIDARFAGLAAAGILELDAQLAGGR